MVVIAGALLVVSTGFLTFMRQSSESVAESDDYLVGGEGEDDGGD